MGSCEDRLLSWLDCAGRVRICNQLLPCVLELYPRGRAMPAEWRIRGSSVSVYHVHLARSRRYFGQASRRCRGCDDDHELHKVQLSVPWCLLLVEILHIPAWLIVGETCQREEVPSLAPSFFSGSHSGRLRYW